MNATDIRTRLMDDLKQAMRDKDEVRRDTIRNIKSSVTNAEVQSGGDLDGEAILQIIRGLSKQRTDSIKQYEDGERKDLADRERAEQVILQAYLPVAPDGAAIEAAVTAAVEQLGASGMKDMGAVMKACKQALGPDVNGKELSTAVRAKLQ